MKTYHYLSCLLCTLGTTAYGQTARFDLDTGSSPTQMDWASVTTPNVSTAALTGTDGPVSITLELAGQSTTWGSRDRLTTASTPGADNDDNQVPEGTNAALYQDFAFAFGGASNAVTVTFTGLQPDTSYDIEVFSYDSAQGQLRLTNWGTDAEPALGSVEFLGDLIGDVNDPDTNALTDYVASLSLISDANGMLVLQGTAASDLLAINGITISAPVVDGDGDGLRDSDEQVIIDADPNDEITTIEDVLPGDDFDMDNLSNETEIKVTSTDPTNPDTDDDQLTDDVETNTGTWVSTSDTGTDPLVKDSDADGLEDNVENPDLPYDSANPTTQPGTDPNIFDSDNDTVSDGEEVNISGTDPTDTNSFIIIDPLDNAIAFDLSPTGGIFAAPWVDTPIPTGTSDPITATAENGVTLTVTLPDGATWDSLDQGVNFGGTPGADNGDVSVPDGTYAAMYQDFAFSTTQTINVSISGLTANTTYPVTIFTYDSAQPATLTSNWGTAGEPDLGSISFIGDNAGIPGLDPDTNTLDDYQTTIEFTSDANGTINFQGTTDNTVMFLNGILVGGAGAILPKVEITDISIDRATGDVTITWDSRVGATYIVRFSDDSQPSGYLFPPVSAWADLDDGVAGQEGSTSFTDPGATNSAPRRSYIVEFAE